MAHLLRKPGTTIHKLGIDLTGKLSGETRKRLEALATTVAISSLKPYNDDPKYFQLWIDTTKSEAELDDWLCRTKCVEHVSVWHRQPMQEI